ncbi:hypothetical protein GIB67_000083 [Kingdonia uniflora]|uniref:GST N-terminal domain-containing protein n=1 Tax=Kingdonia uniflora TaxID=39325 RepID=A0A7J7MPA9_9MAGN|nr:hypothetical protein GIB67_000083 [Kingdonia uniflora]
MAYGGGGFAISYPLAKALEKIQDRCMNRIVQEVIPPVLDSTSDQPPLFDGTTRNRKTMYMYGDMDRDKCRKPKVRRERLYTSLICPYAQRVWITRNYKGLQDKIKLVPLDLSNRPAWYKEKVYPENKVPSLEHNGKIIGESLDLVKYLDSSFEGPSLLPDVRYLILLREFAEELLSYTDILSRDVHVSFKGDADIGAPYDHLETALSKFEDGPFFLGQFSLVDIVYAPFIERYHLLSLDVKKYDITTGRPKLTAWIEELNKIEAYQQTKRDPAELIPILKNRLGVVILY